MVRVRAVSEVGEDLGVEVATDDHGGVVHWSSLSVVLGRNSAVAGAEAVERKLLACVDIGGSTVSGGDVSGVPEAVPD